MNLKIAEGISSSKFSAPAFSQALQRTLVPPSNDNLAIIQKPPAAVATSFSFPSWKTAGAVVAGAAIGILALKFGMKKFRGTAKLAFAEGASTGFVARQFQKARKLISDPLGIADNNVVSRYADEVEALHKTAEPSAEKVSALKNLAVASKSVTNDVSQIVKPTRVGEIGIYFKKFFDLFETRHDEFVKYNNELGQFAMKGREKYYGSYGDMTKFINDPSGQADEIVELGRILREYKSIIDILADGRTKRPALERSMILRKEILRQVADPDDYFALKLNAPEQIRYAAKLAEVRKTQSGELSPRQIFKVPKPFINNLYSLHGELLRETPPKLQNAAKAIFGDSLELNAWNNANNTYNLWRKRKQIYDIFHYV